MRLSSFVILLVILALAFTASGIQAQAIASLQIYPSEAKMRFGSQLRFVAVAMAPDGSFFASNAYWNTNGGALKPAGATAKYTANTYGVFTITASAGGRNASAQVHIKSGSPSGAVSLTVYPSSVKVRPGNRIFFTAVAYDSSSSAYTPINVNWNAGGGSIDSSGGYNAGGMGGTFNVTAWGDGRSGSAHVRIKGGSGPTPPMPPTPPTPHPHHRIVRLKVTPDKAYLRKGQSTQFRAIGYDRYGRPRSVTPVWTTNGGHIDANGLFRARRSGTYTINARDPYSNVSDNATVFVSGSGGHHPGPPGPPVHGLARLDISPNSMRLQPGQKVKFSAVGYNRYGRIVACNPIWTANGGSINQRGFYRANYVSGRFTVSAHVGHVRATAHVYIGSGHHPHPNPHPQPHPHPHPSNARIVITDFDCGGNFFRPRVRITLQVFGYNVQSVRLYGISPNGAPSQLDAASCGHGQVVRFESKFSRFGTKYFEIKLFNNRGRCVAVERRDAK